MYANGTAVHFSGKGHPLPRPRGDEQVPDGLGLPESGDDTPPAPSKPAEE